MAIARAAEAKMGEVIIVAMDIMFPAYSAKSMPYSDISKPITHQVSLSDRASSIVGYRDGLDFFNYKCLSASRKVDKIAHHIKVICNDLQEKSPNAMWIVGLPEYVVKGERSKFVTLEQLNYYKKTMQSLAKTYPNLVIIGGTLAVKRMIMINKKAVLDRISKEYKQHDRIADLESKREKDEPRLSAHQQQVSKVEKMLEDFEVVSNTAYVFQGDAIYKHRKTTPYAETVDDNKRHDDNLVFRVGSARTKSPVITLHHPITKEEITVIVEICREHNLGVARDQAAKAMLHFICSDCTNLAPDAMHGQVVVHFDKIYKPKHIYTDKDNNPSHVHVYHYDMLKVKDSLRGPLEPIYPIELELLKLLDKAIGQLPVENPGQAWLEKIRRRFVKYEYCLVILEKDILDETTKTALSTAGEDVQTILTEILHLIKNKERQDLNWLGDSPCVSLSRAKV